MWFKCTISMYYFKRISILSKNALFTPIFYIVWTVLKMISNHHFLARTHLFEKLATFSWMTKPQKRRTDLFEELLIEKIASVMWLHFNIWRPYQHFNKSQKHKKGLPAILLNGKKTKKEIASWKNLISLYDKNQI